MIDSIKQKTGVLIMHKTTNYAVITLIFAAALSYVYFANMAVRTLTVLEKTKGQMQSLSIEVSEMESERLTLENSINTEKATSLGFVEIAHQTFVMRNSQNISLSLKK